MKRRGLFCSIQIFVLSLGLVFLIFVGLLIIVVTTSNMQILSLSKLGNDACTNEVLVEKRGVETKWVNTESERPVIEGPVIIADTVSVLRQSKGFGTADLYVYDLMSGNLLWSRQGLTGGFVDKEIAYNNIYIAFSTTPLGVSDKIEIVDIKTGAIKSHIQTEEYEQILMDTTSIYVSSNINNNVLAYDLDTSELHWQTENLSERGREISLFLAPRALVSVQGGGIQQFDFNDGSLLSQLNLYFPIGTTILDNRVLVEEQQQLVMRDLVGNILWQSTLMVDTRYWSPVVDDKYLYIADAKSGRLYVLEIETGRMLWSYPPPDEDIKIISGPAIYDNKVWALFSDASLRGLAKIDGTEQAQLRNSVIDYWETNTGAFFAIPAVVSAQDILVVSFGCKSLTALAINE